MAPFVNQRQTHHRPHRCPLTLARLAGTLARVVELAMDQTEHQAIATGLRQLADDIDTQAELLRLQLSASDLRTLQAVADRLRDNAEVISVLTVGEPSSQRLLLAQSRASLSGCADDLCAFDRRARASPWKQLAWAVPRIWDDLCAFKRRLPPVF